MSVSNIHKTYKIKRRNLITEPLPRYTYKSGQIVDFSTGAESREIEVTTGFVSSNRVWWLSSTDNRRLGLSGDPVDSHNEVGTQIEVTPELEPAQTETTVAISAMNRGPEVHVNFWHNRYFGTQNEAANQTFFGLAKSLPNLIQPFQI